MEDHLNSNVDLDPSVPMSVYQVATNDNDNDNENDNDNAMTMTCAGAVPGALVPARTGARQHEDQTELRQHGHHQVHHYLHISA